MPDYELTPTERTARYLKAAEDMEACVASGDLARFRQIVYADGEQRILSADAARVLREGFRVGVLGGTVFHRSFIAACMAEGRPEFAHEIMACARAALARLSTDQGTAPKADSQVFLRNWFATLCSARRGDQYEFVTPPQLVRQLSRDITEYRDFIMMTLEYLPHDEALHRARNRDDESESFVRECEMALRIRQHSGADPQARAPAQTTRATRARL